jgi:hypothetical protein
MSEDAVFPLSQSIKPLGSFRLKRSHHYVCPMATKNLFLHGSNISPIVELNMVEEVGRETIRLVLKRNELKPWLTKRFCIPRAGIFL